MRLHKLAILLAFLCSLAQAQTTTTFTGTIKDLTGSAVTSGNVTFTLQPGADTTISGSARFTPQTVTCGINGSGLVKANDLTNPCVVTNNTALQPAGTSYKVQICPAFACTASLVTYALGGSVDITTLIPTPAQTPAYSLVDIFQNQSIAGNKTFTGITTFAGNSIFNGNGTFTSAVTLSGTTTAYSFNNMVTPLFYGAKCDGTTDDSVPLQNTINAAMTISNSAPSYIFIPPGPGCFFLSTLNIQGLNNAPQVPTLRIEGAHPKLSQGNAGSSLIYGGSTNAFVIQNSGGPNNPLTVNITFANLHFESTHVSTSFITGHSVLGPFNVIGSNFNGANLMQSAIVLDNQSGIQINIENDLFTGFLANEVKLTGVGPTNIKDSQFFASPVGIYVDGGNVNIKDNYFELMTVAVEAANDNGAIGEYDIDGNTFNVGQSPPAPGTNTANQRCLLVKSTNNAQPHYSFGSFKNNACRVNTGFTQGIATNAIQFSLASNAFFATAQWEIENNDISGFTGSAITSDSAGVGGGAVLITYGNDISRAELSYGSFEAGSLPQVSGSGIFAQRAFVGTGINSVGSVKVSALGTPSLPVMGQAGTPGVTSYTYFCVAKDINGRATLPSSGNTIATGNAVLTSANYNTVTCGWGGMAGAASYDVLKTNTSTFLGNIIPPQIGGAATLKDVGQGTSGYTPQTVDQTLALVMTEGAAVSGAASTLSSWADSGDHMWKYNPNNAGEQHIPQVLLLTSAYTNATTGFTTVAGGNTFSFTVAANKNYAIDCHLYYQAAATGGLNIQFAGPAAPTNLRYAINEPLSASTNNTQTASAFATSLGAVVTTAATDFDAAVTLGLVNGANAGTVTLQAKSSAAVNLTIQPGSYCQIQ